MGVLELPNRSSHVSMRRYFDFGALTVAGAFLAFYALTVAALIAAV